jgi:hypothetical protein
MFCHKVHMIIFSLFVNKLLLGHDFSQSQFSLETAANINESIYPVRVSSIFRDNHQQCVWTQAVQMKPPVYTLLFS